MGEPNATHLQRHFFKMMLLIKELNALVEKQPHDVGWIGKPRVIEQLLADVHRQLKAHLGEAWQMPAPRLVLAVIEKVYKLGIEA